jgi:lipoprotein-releasing system permease protein
LLYKILNSEKWAIFLILTFVLIIAIFNIIGSLTMLVIDKRKDIAILSSLGANRQLIRGIFFIEGMMISMLGCIVGMVAGLVFILLQQKFGFIAMSGANLIIDHYPVGIKISDFVLVFGTVLIVSVIVGVIVEAKKPTNKAEMMTTTKLNAKGFSGIGAVLLAGADYA